MFKNTFNFDYSKRLIRKTALLLSCYYLLSNNFFPTIEACRVGSEILKLYTTKSIERIIDANNLKNIYWQNEPLNIDSLSKVIGLNITLAETEFNLDNIDLNSVSDKSKLEEQEEENEDEKNEEENLEKENKTLLDEESNEIDNKLLATSNKLIQDIFVTCSADRDKSYTLTINLELNNPFKVIEFRFNQQQQQQQLNNNSSSKKQETVNSFTNNGLFRIYLPDSTFLVQLNQRINYDECLDVKYVQLGSNINYQVECLSCDENQRNLLDRIFSRRMTQFDAELDSILSEKLLLGLKVLLNQQRLDLDLFLN